MFCMLDCQPSIFICLFCFSFLLDQKFSAIKKVFHFDFFSYLLSSVTIL
uniref:Uncharacterized protein n=1 Tax=Rhizophora mucronata TaxID=61149 RepID=A0A2P2PXB2_RHIMU